MTRRTQGLEKVEGVSHALAVWEVGTSLNGAGRTFYFENKTPAMTNHRGRYGLQA
jgi:hypothetical protein